MDVTIIHVLDGAECWYCEGSKKVWLDTGYGLCPVCNGTGRINEGVTEDNPFPKNDKPLFGVGERIAIPDYATFYIIQLGFTETAETVSFWANTNKPDIVNSDNLPCIYMELDKTFIRGEGFTLLEDWQIANG